MEKTNNPSVKKLVSFVAIAIIFALVGMILSAWYVKYQRDSRVENHQEAYKSSLLRNDPAQLQTLFAEDVAKGINDQYTRSAAFWILHRYFDNGGNVFEIHDFIASKPQLAFINTEAEQIYPQNFQWLKDGTLPRTYATRAKYVMLAYLEVLDNHGYGTPASRGMLAQQYAFEALYSIKVPKDFPEGFDHKAFRENAQQKAVKYLKLSSQDVADIIDGKITTNNMPARDILLSVDQYGAATRYLARQNVVVTGLIKTANEAFDFATPYARQSVPELYLFTNYLNASTQLYDPKNASEESIRQALFPFYTFALPKEQRRPGNIVDRIINSKSQTYDSIDLYGKTNALWLASIVPEYKEWLIANGWDKEEFIYSNILKVTEE